MDFPAGTAQEIPVNAGWNWFSLNLFQIDMSPDGVLGDLNPRAGIS